jgi:hypothetical protein
MQPGWVTYGGDPARSSATASSISPSGIRADANGTSSIDLLAPPGSLLDESLSIAGSTLVVDAIVF